MVIGGLVALFGALLEAPAIPWLGLVIAAAGFVMWQVNARRALKKGEAPEVPR